MTLAPRYRWMLAAAGVAAIVVALLTLPLQGWILDAVTWIRDAGAAGIAVYAALYVVATLAFLPASLLTLGAGFAYGPVGGTLLVSPVSVLAATAAFLLGRSALRPWVARRARTAPRFAAIDAAIEGGGAKLVALLRLSPFIPFSLFNYALGLTRVRLGHFVLGSFVGMLPLTAAYVYLGSLVSQPAALGRPDVASDSPVSAVLYWVGLAATLLVAAIATRIARRALRRTLASDPATAPPAPPEVPW